MKKFIIIISAALALAACAKENPVEVVTGGETVLTVTGEASRTYLDNMSVMWKTGEAIVLFSRTGEEYSSHKFTCDSDSTKTAVFKGDGGIAIDANAYVLYPYSETAEVDCTAGVKIKTNLSTISQKVYPDTFVDGLNIAVGQCTKDRTVTMKNVGTLLKFTLTQEGVDTLRCIEIVSNGGEVIAIDGPATIDWNGGEPTVAPGIGASTSDVITLLPGNGTFEADSTYYVWVTPGTLASGITVNLYSHKLYKAPKAGTSALVAVRNQIVDLEQVKDLVYSKPVVETKTIEFDFTGTPQEGWPTKDKWVTVEVAPVPDSTCCYKKSETESYPFVIAACRAAKEARIAWATAEKGTGLTLYAAQRFLGLPAIEGYRLAEVHCVQGTLPRSSRKGAICDRITETTAEAYSTVDGSEPMGGTHQVWDVENLHYYLRTTEKGKVYYLTCTAGGIGSKKITLVYTK